MSSIFDYYFFETRFVLCLIEVKYKRLEEIFKYIFVFFKQIFHSFGFFIVY